MDSKSFFTYVRSKTRVKTTVGPLRDDNNVLITSGRSYLMIILLQYLLKRTLMIYMQSNQCSVEKIVRNCNFHISLQKVINKLKKFKMNNAPGIDLIGTRMLIELSGVVRDTVAKIYNKSLRREDTPDDWRLANVTAVFKNGKSHLRQTTDLLV